jgi:hypothetical protein
VSLPPLSRRDRNALAALGVCAAVFAAVYLWPAGDSSTVGAVNSIPQIEQRVSRLRRLAAAVPARQQILAKVEHELASREKGLIQAETAAQAQAQLLQIARRVARLQNPPLVFKGTEFAPPRPFGDAYGEVVMTVSIDAGIEQIVNFLADVSNQPELVSVSDTTFSQVAGNQKLVPARITFTGIVPRKLVPQKKEGAF